ncbi:3-hydroxyacyl-CoA dehydrogenase family protein [Guptibacillus hwajinpoensis]|uniref:3-hydroxyacyl-CoA dehydrogenase family protein n=1 Tax=Guptibacillus hwajinpoensis TaxID=208199 RepID=UPI001CFCAFC6|nr:3-hydroxyacyl-CoA dehydrogenase NAD-binding domain-containing protein [Pseudalkalibacillus hwajinpoensis]WLR61012.1 3-hydroxyacyl-CoA dehydrogenase NAD-binding domain-containing protein [Pseudalkalibacillus hwajinpoensis]
MVIKKVAIVGGGLMGAGIAQVVAKSGCEVVLIEANENQLEKSMALIQKNFDRSFKEGRISSLDMQESLAQISGEITVHCCKDADLVIEAVTEDLELKKKVFEEISEVTGSKQILASNTSGLSIAAIGAATSKPSNVIGLHFFYPVPLMDLVEVIPSLMTSEQTLNTMLEFVGTLGKEPVKCPDYPGFLVNRILIPMVNEAIYCVMEGASPEEVDSAMKLGANHKMGPITLADFVGLDVLLATMEGLCEGFDDSKYRPCPLLKKMVETGKLGRKTGRGFYDYTNRTQMSVTE